MSCNSLSSIRPPDKAVQPPHPQIAHNDAYKSEQITTLSSLRQTMASAEATMQPPPPLPPPPDPALILFARGVIARLEVWPALRVAVEQGWGGPSSREKRRWLASEIVDAFDADGVGVGASSSADAGQDRRDAHDAHAHGKNKSTTPDAEYVGLMLAQALEDEFDALFEDGSVEAVAADVVALWGAEEDVVREWEGKVEGVRGRNVDVQEVEGDEE